MEEECAVGNMASDMEKRSKHKLKKAKKTEGTAEEAKNAGKVKAFKDTQIPENEDIAEEKRHRNSCDKEKKKNKGTNDSDSSMGRGSNGKDDNGDTMSVIERKENENKIKKKRENTKDKDGVFEGGNAEEVESDKRLEGESYKERRKEKRNRKSIMNSQDSDIEKEAAKDVGMHAELCQVHDVEAVQRKKRKRDGKKDKNDNNGQPMLDLITSNDSMANMTVDNENNRKDLSKTLNREEDLSTKAERGKKKRERKENDEDNLSTLQQENLPKNCEDNIQPTKHDRKEFERKKGHKKKNTKLLGNGVDEIQGDELSVNKVKGKQIMSQDSDDIQDDDLKSATGGMKKPKNLGDDGPDDQTPQKSNKKVRFSGQDEVFPVPIDLNAAGENDDADNLVRGKRFTHEEDELVKEAVENYIQEHDLGEEGLDMILNSRKHPQLKGCWKDIGAAIPYRPYTAVYYRAQVLFRRSEHRKWTQEECDEVLKYQEKYGNQWKQLAEELGKHRWHVKDTWRRLKLANLKKGHWSQDEYQKLFDLVNYDLQLKALALEDEKNSKHGMLRDNIPWTAISDKLSTRNQANCCLKWYNQLTSPMVSEGLWADVDDYRLLGALYSLDATCMEDVDWDDLVANRPGDVCRKRWNQMVLHIGHHGNKSFAEQVEVLAQRYCPHLLEAREAWDSKPKIP